MIPSAILTYISSSDIMYDAKAKKLIFVITKKTVNVTDSDVIPIETVTARIAVDDPSLGSIKFITQ